MINYQSVGWGTILLEDKFDHSKIIGDRFSYLTDAPIDMLQAVYENLAHRKPTSVKFDAEGWEWILVFDLYTGEIHYITNDESEIQYKKIKVDRREFCKSLVEDIMKEIHGFTIWEDIPSTKSKVFSETEYENRRKKIEDYCISITMMLNVV